MEDPQKIEPRRPQKELGWKGLIKSLILGLLFTTVVVLVGALLFVGLVLFICSR